MAVIQGVVAETGVASDPTIQYIVRTSPSIIQAILPYLSSNSTMPIFDCYLCGLM